MVGGVDWDRLRFVGCCSTGGSGEPVQLKQIQVWKLQQDRRNKGSVVVASVETLGSLVDGPVSEPGGKEVGWVCTSWLYTHTCNDISCGMDDIVGAR